ncbi:7-carboxy-7-deazaguanine synthase QueE [Paenibacillus yanchengensis]|uniref:7-carboxy-7-deazaguanine synthase n=1 Tax=Paenibacillus yanchengensis TaxID=2035833 RepID=A0ABW4YNK0_9BACL
MREQEKKLPVLEIFGPTVQGEGMVIGRKTMFVRTAGCDYRCVWCDSAFTWDGSGKDRIRMMTASQIVDELISLGGERFNHVTISGGNPALLAQLTPLIQVCHEQQWTVALETQGSRYQPWFLEIDELTISPKPPSSTMETDWEVLDEIVTTLTENNRQFCLKVVIMDELDFTYAKQVHQRYDNVPFYVQVGNDHIEEQDTKQLLMYLLERYEWLVEQVMNDDVLRGVYVLPQLHTWLWGNKQGV